MAYGFQNDKSKVDIIDLVYPVESIYMSVNNVDPSTIFGGTWAAWGAGRVPVGVDTSDSDFDTAEETGGAKTHDHGGATGSTTLTIDQIPSHNHTVTLHEEPTGAKFTVKSDLLQDNGFAPSGNFPVNATGSTGGGEGHTHTISSVSSLQPYITCYMWKRTA